MTGTDAADAALPVVVLGTTVLNGGDAALLAGELETLRLAFGDVRVTVFDQEPDVARQFFPGLDLRRTLTWPRGTTLHGRTRKLRWAWRTLRLTTAALALRRGHRRVAGALAPGPDALDDLLTYQRAAVALTPAGTMLVDQYNFLPRLVDYLIVIALDRPLVVFTQTVGGFPRPVDRILGRVIFRRAALVLLRGPASHAHALSLGADPARTRVVADPAFLLTRLDRGERAPGALRVAISVREWPFFATSPEHAQRRYEEAVASLCVRLVRERDARLTFVSTCQGIPEYWVDDSLVAARIVASLPTDVARAVCVDSLHRIPHELRDLLATFDLVVATRLHAAVLGLAAGTPAVGIAYEPKTGEVFERLGIVDWVIGIEDIDGDALWDVVARTIAELPDRVPALLQAVGRERDDAAAVAELLRDALHYAHEP